MAQKVLNSKADIGGNLSHKDGRDIPARVKRYSRTPSIGMTVLFMQAPLPHFPETEPLQNGDNLPGIENRNFAHVHATITD